jgi:hypothetical protein
MRSQVLYDDRWPDDGTSSDAVAGETRLLSRGVDVPGDPGRGSGVPGRYTVTITGLGAEGYATRNGTRPSTAIRHSKLKPHERAGFRPDRVAMWAVFLGVMLVLVAAASSHAAVLAGHLVH